MDVKQGDWGSVWGCNVVGSAIVSITAYVFFFTAANSLNKSSFGEQILGLDGGLICCCYSEGDWRMAEDWSLLTYSLQRRGGLYASSEGKRQGS